MQHAFSLSIFNNPNTENDAIVELCKLETKKLTILNSFEIIENCIKISKYKNINVDKSLAKNPNTPIKILEKLSKHNDYTVRYNVAENPNTPIEVLKKLSKDTIETVRMYVAYNRNTTIGILDRLYRDVNPVVRYTVADNTNTPCKILKELLNDSYYDCRKSALETLIKKKSLKLFT